MKYELSKTTRFKKDFKLAVKRGLPISELEKVIGLLADGKILPEKYRDHPLTGNFAGHRECHILTRLPIYCPENDRLVLTLAHTGTHSDLLNM